MKFTMKSRNWVMAMVMLTLPGAMLTSCSKDATTEQVAPKGDKLVISVKGIKNATDAGALKQGVGSKTTAKEAPNYKVYEFSDVDMAVSVDDKLPIKTTNVARGKSANGAFAAAAAEELEAMAVDAKYMLYIYDGETLVASTELTVGTDGTVEGLDASKGYTWVAVSYNNETIPEVSNGVANLPFNTDVLYAKGTVDLSDDPTISITFGHVFARIGIELNTMGVFGEITGNPTVSVGGLELATGSMDLLTGVLTPNSETTTATLTYADFVSVEEGYEDAKIAYVYTAPTAEQQVTLSVQGLDVVLADGGATRNYFAAAAPVTLPAIDVTPVAGSSHHLLFNLVEAPLVTNHRRNALNQRVRVEWARSNLYYRGEGGARNYGFYANNGPTSRADGYFAFEGLEPMKFTSDADKGDPCALVYPAGVWRTPTATEINSITTSSGVLGNLLSGILDAILSDPAPGSSYGTDYIQYSLVTAPSGTNAFGSETSNSNNLRFFYNGQITNATVLTALGDDGLVGVGLSDLSLELADIEVLDTNIPILGNSFGLSAGLWTNTRLVSGPLLSALGTSVGSQGYLAYTGRTLAGTRFAKATTTAELLGNVDLLGLDVANISLKNVRCVRAN